jgi:hypothetical protein
LRYLQITSFSTFRKSGAKFGSSDSLTTFFKGRSGAKFGSSDSLTTFFKGRSGAKFGSSDSLTTFFKGRSGAKPPVKLSLALT